MIVFAVITLQKLELSEYKSCMLKVGRNCNYQTANFRTLRLQTMHVKNAKKASSKLQRMQTTFSRNYCSINAPKLSAVIHCLQWMTAKIALKLQWEIEHSGNLQNLQGNYLQCRSGVDRRHFFKAEAEAVAEGPKPSAEDRRPKPKVQPLERSQASLCGVSI